MSFNLHRGLSRIIDTIFGITILFLIIGFFITGFLFFNNEIALKEIGYYILGAFLIALGAIVIRWALYYIINGFFDGK